MWLLVEDDPDIRTIVAMMMTVWGEEPLAFPDGRTAWSWLDTVETGTNTETLPELALMDIRMPGYTGDQIAARIRMIPALKHIPIILMTAFNKSEDEVEALRKNAGIDHFLNKPLPDMDDFRDTLYRVRDERRAKLLAQSALIVVEPTSSAIIPAVPSEPPTAPTPPSEPPAPHTEDVKDQTQAEQRKAD